MTIGMINKRNFERNAVKMREADNGTKRTKEREKECEGRRGGRNNSPLCFIGLFKQVI
jgi:hypothetical protein